MIHVSWPSLDYTKSSFLFLTMVFQGSTLHEGSLYLLSCIQNINIGFLCHCLINGTQEGSLGNEAFYKEFFMCSLPQEWAACAYVYAVLLMLLQKTAVSDCLVRSMVKGHMIVCGSGIFQLLP